MGLNPSGQPAPQALDLSPEEVRSYLEANGSVGRTERFLQLDRYDAFYAGLEYVHQDKDWWGRSAEQMETVSPVRQLPPGFVSTDGEAGLKVRDKRPTAPSRLGRTIVRRFTGLLFSQKRIPHISASNPEDEAFCAAVIKQTRFWVKWREARNKGGSCGSVALTLVVREGKFVLEVHRSKNVTVVWKDRTTWSPLAFLISYVTQKEEPNYDERGQRAGTKIVEYVERRIITEAEDVVYKPVRLEEAHEVAWEPDPYLYVRHDLGFCPGIWVQNHEEGDDPDGDPDCAGTFETIDTYDRLTSQMNFGCLNNLDPTPVIAHDPKEVQSVGGMRKGSGNSLYVGKSGNAGYMEMSGSGVQASSDVADRLKQQVLDTTRCILVDPKDLTGAAQSAKAIELMFEPMIECADELRDQYGDGITRSLDLAARMYRKLHGRAVTVSTPEGPREATLAIFLKARSDGSEQEVSENPEFEPKWGDYFEPTEQDKQQRVATATAAKTGGLIDQKTAATYTAGTFSVKDVDEMLVNVQDEQTAGLDQALSDGLSMPALPPHTPT